MYNAKLLPFFLFLVACNSNKTVPQTIITSDESIHTPVVQHFQKSIESGDVEQIAKNVRYPLKRKSPIPEINDEGQFVTRYPEIFDAFLIEKILGSDPSSDWSAVGSQGIMLGTGDLWIDFDGRIISINYESTAEKEIRVKLEKSFNNQLHPSISTFDNQRIEMHTLTYSLRVDQIGNGYRLVVWQKMQSKKEPPIIIVENGQLDYEGSGGNHVYSFAQGIDFYKVYVTPLGAKHNATFQYYEKGNLQIDEGDIAFTSFK